MPLRHFSILPLALTSALLAPLPSASAADGIFDELRFGGAVSIEPHDNHEHGGFVSAMALFDPWDRDAASGWRAAATPRLHVGGDIATEGEANQIYAGFSWTADLTSYLFVEGGLGGTLHDGKLDEDHTPGPKLGSAILFHEYLALGINLDPHWRVIANIEHSSNAGLADPNSGLSRTGVMIGYKF